MQYPQCTKAIRQFEPLLPKPTQTERLKTVLHIFIDLNHMICIKNKQGHQEKQSA